MKRIRRITRGGVVAMLATCSLAFGQIRDIQLQEPLGDQVLPTTLPGPKIPALETVIDRDNYVLGPGDYLEVTVWGSIEVRNMVKVGPDGSVALQTVGVLDISGKTITEAEKLIKIIVEKRYPRANISVRLVGIRRMLASVSGRVRMPGMYPVTAVDRLSALLFQAGGFLEPQAVKRFEEEQTKDSDSGVSETDDKEARRHEESVEIISIQPSLRRISITSRDGLTSEIDYLRYFQFGDLEFNPVLRDGDRIYVPVRNSEVGVVDIYGAVKVPNEYEFVEGDRLLDIVDFAGGFRADAMLEAIVIDRMVEPDGLPKEIVVNLSKPESSERGPLLQPGDQIFVRERFNFRPKFYVEVEGEVKYPGRYPIVENIVTLTELIESCGGFTEEANLRNARLIRAKPDEKINLEFERLSKLTTRDMNEVEYDYFKTESRQKIHEVQVNFEELFIGGNKEHNVTLMNGDIISVPKLSPTVRIVGQVNNPGLVRYVEGMELEDYIREAGGYSWNARKKKIQLIKADTGLWIEQKQIARIDIGDTIFIPENPEFDSWAFTKDLLTVATQLATVFVVVQTLK